jgi:hypothetical protein
MSASAWSTERVLGPAVTLLAAFHLAHESRRVRSGRRDLWPRSAVVMGNLFIVTGASGTGVTNSLSRYCREYGGCVVKLEDHLAEVAKPYLNDSRPLPSMRSVVTLPPAILRTLWPTACAQALDEGGDAGPSVRELLEAGDVFLTFHAAWYHLETTSFVSGVDVGSLVTKLTTWPATPRMVITLIDDIYDTLARLTRPHEVFQQKLHEAPNPISAVAALLLKILAWREFEVRQSQQISMSFMAEVPHVLFAVKHPLMTFAKLLAAQEPRRTYLSHPISEPRRRGLESPAGREMMTFVGAVAANLREHPDLTLIEPTTIDELRIMRDDDQQFIEGISLSERWMPPVDRHGQRVEQLWDGLEHAGGDFDAAARDRAFAAQPFLEAQRLAERLPSADPQIEAARLSPAEASAAALELVEVLAEEIRHQVNWRDRQLVSESQGLVIIRPFSKSQGSHSRSVGHEMRLHLRLRQFESDHHAAPRRIPAVVYHPQTDERRRRVKGILHVLKHYSQPTQGLIRGWGNESEAQVEQLLMAVDLEPWLELSSNEIGRIVIDLLDGIPTGSRPKLVVPPGGGLDAGLELYGDEDVEQTLGSAVLSALLGSEVPGHPSLAKGAFVHPLHAVTVTRDYDSASDLARQVASQLDRLFGTLYTSPHEDDEDEDDYEVSR